MGNPMHLPTVVKMDSLALKVKPGLVDLFYIFEHDSNNYYFPLSLRPNINGINFQWTETKMKDGRVFG